MYGGKPQLPHTFSCHTVSELLTEVHLNCDPHATLGVRNLDMAFGSWLSTALDYGTALFRGNHVQHYTASCPRRTQSTSYPQIAADVCL